MELGAPIGRFGQARLGVRNEVGLGGEIEGGMVYDKIGL